MDIRKVSETLRHNGAVKDGQYASDGRENPCQQCQQPRVCLCPEETNTRLQKNNFGSPTLKYINIISKKISSVESIKQEEVVSAEQQENGLETNLSCKEHNNNRKQENEQQQQENGLDLLCKDVKAEHSKTAGKQQSVLSGSLRRSSRACLFAGEYPASFYDLLRKLLQPQPSLRISAEEALQHSFLEGARINGS